MYYQNKDNPKKDNRVAEIQRMLNIARRKAFDLVNEDVNRPKLMIGAYKEPISHLTYVPSGWNIIKEDGYYGDLTEVAVKYFQRFFKITENGIVGDTTYDYLVRIQRYNHNVRYQVCNPKIQTAISVSASAIKNTNSLTDVFFNIFETIKKQETSLEEVSKLYEYTSYNVKLGLKKRHALFNKAKEFLRDAGVNGISSAVNSNSGNINRRDLLKYLEDAMKQIKEARLPNIKFSAIQKAIEPIAKILNKIPGLKWIGVVEKLLKAAKRLFWDKDPEGALQLFSNAIREALETIAVDLAVAALVASGLGLLAIVLVVVLFIIDYFFFSDNPGDSLVDKYTPLKTRNVLNEEVSAVLHPNHSCMIIQRGVGLVTKY